MSELREQPMVGNLSANLPASARMPKAGSFRQNEAAKKLSVYTKDASNFLGFLIIVHYKFSVEVARFPRSIAEKPCVTQRKQSCSLVDKFFQTLINSFLALKLPANTKNSRFAGSFSNGKPLLSCDFLI